VERAQTAVGCLGLVALALSQQPGRLVPDTKLDLAIDPVAFLGRALHLWEPEGFAGQVQNQAYGYLFPMGPFFALGRLAGLPPWVVQRLWLALVMVVAFTGLLALAGALRTGGRGGRFAGALAYALAPRLLGAAGSISIEVLPLAIAPWVLVPLVAGARGGSPRRAAALSGVAVLCVGGVNAAATAAVLVLPALWLLTRTPGPRRRRLAVWWTAAVGAATLWWAAPLLLLGRYSPPFLDWIESASTTTAPAELTEALRGTTQWLPRLATPAGPVAPAGWSLVHDLGPVTATVLLAAAGLAALTRRDLPERTWLGLGALAGLTLLVAAHTGPVQGLLATPLQAALDGALAPLRNTHKADPVLRLPLALGLAHLVTVAARRRPHSGPRRWPALAALLAVAVTATPALRGDLHPPTTFAGLPDYWRETAAWLADAQPAGRALLVPASTFGTYVWGSPADEPLQPLAGSPWEVRNAVPLTPAGHIRVLDAVERRLAEGRGSAGLAPFLARSGVSHLVVRNDLDHGGAGAARPAAVHRALADSPGLRRVAAFGPELFTATGLPGVVLDSGLTAPWPAVEVFAVAGTAPRAYTTPLADAVTVRGGPEQLLELEDRDVLAGRPALLPDGTGAAPEGAPSVLGDALVRREHAFGRITDSVSAGLGAGDPLRLDGPARDYLLPDHAAHESVVETTGARLSASGSGSDADSADGSRPGEHPFAAVDGDPATAWRPARTLEPGPQWWRADLPEPVRAPAVTLTLDPATTARAPAVVRVRTDAGELVHPLDRTAAPQRLPLPPGPTRSLVLAFDPVPGALAGPVVGLAEVELPGLDARRSLVLPPAGGPVDAVVLAAAHPARAGCLAVPVTGPDPVRCSADLVRTAEEPTGLDRVLTLTDAAPYTVAATAVPRPGPALDALLARAAGPALTATATSQAVPDPRAGPAAAVDGDPGTTWTADPADPAPRLEVRWGGRRTVDRVRVVLAPGAAAARPVAVTVRSGADERTGFLEPDGALAFAPLTTDRLTLAFPLREDLASFDPYRRGSAELGIGVGEVVVPGAAAVSPAAPVEVPCGAGPRVEVGGTVVPTAVRTTVADLRSLAPVAVAPCGAATAVLGAGTHRVGAAATGAFTPTALTLLAPGTPTGAAPRSPVPAPVWDREHRVLEVPARSAPTLLVVPENTNPGWVATADGAGLPARTVDGWQQGWVLPAGPATTVVLDFTPGGPYRLALLAGGLAVLALLGTALVRDRRPEPAPAPARRPGRILAAAVLGAVALATGWVGLVLVGVLTCGALLADRAGPPALRRALRPVRGRVAAVLAAAALAAAGVARLGGADAVVLRQVLAALAVAALATALLSRRAPDPAPPAVVPAPAEPPAPDHAPGGPTPGDPTPGDPVATVPPVDPGRPRP
jgi:arabinofuranan 3-O-arabinosyltransferase